MYKFDKKAFRRYFFDGNDNPDGALEGMMIYVYSKTIGTKTTNKVLYPNPNNDGESIEECDDIGFREEDSEEIKRTITAFADKVLPLYTQYYRFVELNNKSEVYYYKSEDEKELKKRIGEMIRKLRDEGKLIAKEDEISFSREKIKEYTHFMEGSMTQEEWETKYQTFTIYNQEDWRRRNIPNDLNIWYTMQAESEEKYKYEREEFTSFQFEHWSQAMSKILVALSEIEKEDEKAYCDLWFRTRLKRAKSTKHPIEGIQEKEIHWIENACEAIRKGRILDNEKEELDR